MFSRSPYKNSRTNFFGGCARCPVRQRSRAFPSLSHVIGFTKVGRRPSVGQNRLKVAFSYFPPSCANKSHSPRESICCAPSTPLPPFTSRRQHSLTASLLSPSDLPKELRPKPKKADSEQRYFCRKDNFGQSNTLSAILR